MKSRIGIGFLRVASPFVVTFSTILQVHLASVDVIKEQFFLSSFVVHYNPCHFAIRHSIPDVAVPVAAVAEVVIAVEALQRIHLLQSLAVGVAVDAGVVAVGSASSAELLFVAEAVVVVVVGVLDVVVVVDIAGVVDILE